MEAMGNGDSTVTAANLVEEEQRLERENVTILCQHLVGRTVKALVLPQKVLNVTHRNVLVSLLSANEQMLFAGF